MKEHISHDVLLLCVACHQHCDNHDRFMRRDVCLQYNVPIDAGTQKYHEDSDRVKIRSLARAMIGQQQLPERRKEEIMKKLTEYLECKSSDITPELLQQLANTETRYSFVQYSYQCSTVSCLIGLLKLSLFHMVNL